MSLLEVNDLSLQLGGKQVLRSVDFKLAPGEFHIIIGPNGAGKTSFLKCVLNLISNYTGEIKLDGALSQGMSSKERAVVTAYVPQFLDLQFNLDVKTFMELSRYAYHGEPIKQRDRIIRESLEQTGALEFAEAFLDELSGGERQRVMIAAGLAQRPKLLVMDEPSQSLDPSHRIELVRLLERLRHNSQLAILLVTHDWNELVHLDPKVLALKDGSVAFATQANHLPSHLEDLFECPFHHLQVDQNTISLPRYRV